MDQLDSHFGSTHNAAKLATGRALVKSRKRKKKTMKSTQKLSRVVERIRLR